MFQYLEVYSHSKDSANTKEVIRILIKFANQSYTNFLSYLCNVPGAVARSEACLLGMQAAPTSIPTSSTFFHGDLVMK